MNLEPGYHEVHPTIQTIQYIYIPLNIDKSMFKSFKICLTG